MQIFFLVFSVANFAAVNGHISNEKDSKISSLRFMGFSESCKAAHSIYELYSIVSNINLYEIPDELCKIKSAIVEKLNELDVNEVLAETLKDLIMRNNFSYVHFYCWAKGGPKFSYTGENFKSQLVGSIAIEYHFRSQIEAMYQERAPIDFHVVGLMIEIVEKFATRSVRGDLYGFWKKNLKSRNFFTNLLKEDPHAQFKEIIRKYDLEGGLQKFKTGLEGRILAQDGFFNLQHFSKTLFIQGGLIVDWNFVNSLSPGRLLALFYVHLETGTGEFAAKWLLKILGLKFNENSYMMKLFLESFFPFYHSLFETSKDECENIIRMGDRLKRLFKSQQIQKQFLIKMSK
jgi:hypothetical protein